MPSSFPKPSQICQQAPFKMPPDVSEGSETNFRLLMFTLFPHTWKKSLLHLPHTPTMDRGYGSRVSADRKSGCLFKADSSEGAFASRPDYRGELTGLHLHNNGETEGAAVGDRHRWNEEGGGWRYRRVLMWWSRRNRRNSASHMRRRELLTCDTSVQVLTQLRQEVWNYISRKTHWTNNHRGHTGSNQRNAPSAGGRKKN